MTMWTAVLATTLLIAAAQCTQYTKCNLDYYNTYSCNYDNLCLFGCHDNKCWSQCNGMGDLAWDGPKGTCNNWYNFTSKIEWCYSSGAPTCSDDADCVDYKGNSCSGSCSVGFSNPDPSNAIIR